MNRFERNLGFKGEAKLKYLDGEVQVVTPGDFVRCAVTGRTIPLEELRYWSVELQEAYIDAAATAKFTVVRVSGSAFWTKHNRV